MSTRGPKVFAVFIREFADYISVCRDCGGLVKGKKVFCDHCEKKTLNWKQRFNAWLCKC